MQPTTSSLRGAAGSPTRTRRIARSCTECPTTSPRSGAAPAPAGTTAAAAAATTASALRDSSGLLGEVLVQAPARLALKHLVADRVPPEEVRRRPERLLGPAEHRERVTVLGDLAVTVEAEARVDLVDDRAAGRERVARGPVRRAGRLVGLDVAHDDRQVRRVAAEHRPHRAGLAAVQLAERGIA